MAYKQPEHKTFEDLLTYYISLYYIIREKNPGLKHLTAKHIREIEKLEADYHQKLARRHTDWDNEENRQRLHNQIDFLTGVFSDQKKAEQKTASTRALLDKLKR